MWRLLLTKLACYKVPLVMVSTHGSVVPLAMFNMMNKTMFYCDYAFCRKLCIILRVEVEKDDQNERSIGPGLCPSNTLLKFC